MKTQRFRNAIQRSRRCQGRWSGWPADLLGSYSWSQFLWSNESAVLAPHFHSGAPLPPTTISTSHRLPTPHRPDSSGGPHPGSGCAIGMRGGLIHLGHSTNRLETGNRVSLGYRGGFFPDAAVGLRLEGLGPTAGPDRGGWRSAPARQFRGCPVFASAWSGAFPRF